MPQEPVADSAARAGRFVQSQRGQPDAVSALQRFAAAEQARQQAPQPAVAPSQGLLARLFGYGQQAPVPAAPQPMQQQPVAPSQGFLSRFFGQQQAPVSTMAPGFVPHDINLPLPKPKPPVMMPVTMK